MTLSRNTTKTARDIRMADPRLGPKMFRDILMMVRPEYRLAESYGIR